MSSRALELVNDAEILHELKSLMWKAGEAILEIYNLDDFGTEIKGDDSPVTKADLAAHHILIRGLYELTPDIPVVSEEDAESIRVGHSSPVYWLIDPLDGTKEFIKRNGEFTCNLALIENKHPTLGLVGVPAVNELYLGGAAIPSTRESVNGAAETIQHKPAPNITRVVASKSHLNDETRAFIENLEGEVALVQAGSSLKFLKIATGEADIYPRLAPTCEWDTAAAHAVLNGAGGEALQVNGEPMTYGKGEILNPHFVAKAHS